MEQVYQNQNVLVSGDRMTTIPEDLVQIQAYLRWERKGRQAYTPDQEKVSFLGL